MKYCNNILDYKLILQNNTSFIQACKSNNYEFCKFLVENHNDKDFINHRDNDGNTGFMYACENENSKLVNLLLNYVEDIKNVNNDGNNALQFTFKYKLDLNIEILKIVKLLLPHIKDINYRNNTENTVFHIACISSNYEVVEYLLTRN